MEELKTRLIESLLKTLTYDDMNEEQMELVVEYETELWRKKIDSFISRNMTKTKIKEHIHDWWLDYEIADGTE